MVWYKCTTDERYKVRTQLEFMAIDVLPGRGIYLVPDESADLLDELMARYEDDLDVDITSIRYEHLVM
jgi:hypothetical protein